MNALELKIESIYVNRDYGMAWSCILYSLPLSFYKMLVVIITIHSIVSFIEELVIRGKLWAMCFWFNRNTVVRTLCVIYMIIYDGMRFV